LKNKRRRQRWAFFDVELISLDGQRSTLLHLYATAPSIRARVLSATFLTSKKEQKEP
jgi:hypothetical protein